MSFEIVTIVPTYYFLLCLAAAGIFTWLLYRKHQFENVKWARVMMALRFVGLFLLFILLLSPLFRLKKQTENKPELLVFYDHSFSVDSTAQKEARKAFTEISHELEKKFSIRSYFFASDVQESADSLNNRNETQMGGIFDFTNDYFEGSNTSAVVLVSDGINNKGINPLYKSFNKKVPLFTVGLGDTAMYPDIWLSEINANSTVFLNNEFTVGCNLRAYGLKGRQLAVDLLQDGVKIQSQNKQITEDGWFGTLDFILKPTAPGMKHYEIRVAPVSGESNGKNNAKSVFVRVTDTRRKIAICYQAPHPDIGALARSLEQFGQYEVVKIPAAAKPDPGAFDIFILHGLAGNATERDLVNDLINKGKATWLILSAQSDPRFSVFDETGMKLQFYAGNLTEAQGTLNTSFSEFLTDDEFAAGVKFWPPLKVPFGKYEMPKMFKPFLMQKIGAVETSFPLMGFTAAGGKRQAWLFGEGLWRWRMRDAEQNGTPVIFDNWIAKNIQYLTTDEVREKFRAFAENPLISQKENVVIFAEYLDQSLQLVNKPDATLKIAGPNNFVKEMPFSRSGNRYKAEVGSLPAGDYTFSARLASSPVLNYIGKFAVVQTDPESENTRADHGLLRRLAARNNGTFYSRNEFKKLGEDLLNKKEIHATLSEETSVLEFIHLKWIFALLVLLFGAEWFLRKREGSY